MDASYVERHEEGFRVAGSRVSLDSIVYAFWNGESAESIAEAFPVLTLEQVYGAIAFYLAHRDEVESHLQATRANAELRREESRRADPAFYRRLAAARQSLHVRT